jgi:hypothetical protein
MRAHYSELRISPLFTDLNPEAGGTVRWTQTPAALWVQWRDVPEYAESTAEPPRLHSFQVAIRKDGHIDMRWPKNDLSALDVLVGLSTKIMGWQAENFTRLDAADAKCDAQLALQTKEANPLWAPGQVRFSSPRPRRLSLCGGPLVAHGSCLTSPTWHAQELPPNFENQAEPTQEFGEPVGTDSDATMGGLNALDLQGKKLVFYPANYTASNYNFSRWAYNKVCHWQTEGGRSVLHEVESESGRVGEA